MIKALNSKAFDTIKDGVKDGMETAWKQSKRVILRSPWAYNKPTAFKSAGWIGAAILSVAAIAAGAWLYFRKRKQVADHYTIGEGPAADWQPEQSRVDEHLASAGA